MKSVKNLLTVSLGVTTLFLSVFFLHETEKMKQNQLKLIDFTASVQMKEYFYRSNFDANAMAAGSIASEITCMDSLSSSNLLSEITKGKPVLVYRFTDNYCEPCHIENLTEIQAVLLDIIDAGQVIALSSNKKERDLLILSRTHGLHFPIYLIPPDSFDWVMEKNNIPYFFVLHPDMRISNIFIPDNHFPEVLKRYLAEVKRLF